MQSLQSLLKHGFTDRIRGNADAERLEQVLVDTVRNFSAEVANIRQEYHPNRQQEKIRQRAEAILTEMESGIPGSLLRQLGRAWATARESLARNAGLGPSSDPSATVREMWALDRLREMDAGKRLLLLQQAVAAGDEVTVRAALNAPRAFAVVDDRMAEEIRQAWHERACPDEAAHYQRLREAYTCEQANYADAVGAIREIGGLSDDMRSRLEQAQAGKQ